jgi:hypothetical protein
MVQQPRWRHLSAAYFLKKWDSWVPETAVETQLELFRKCVIARKYGKVVIIWQMPQPVISETITIAFQWFI